MMKKIITPQADQQAGKTMKYTTKIITPKADQQAGKNMFEQLSQEIKEWLKSWLKHFQSKSLKDKKYLRSKDFDFSILEVYVEEDHIDRKLLKHNPSGELYFYEWYEEIDWVDGNDPQYVTYVPVESAEEAEALSCPEVTYYGGGFGSVSRIIDNQYTDGSSELRWIRV